MDLTDLVTMILLPGEVDSTKPAKAPVTSLYDNEAYYAVVNIAGVSPGSISTTVEGDVLTIRGKRECKFLTENKNFVEKQVLFGEFLNKFDLPADAQRDKVVAELYHGLLYIRIPRTLGAPPQDDVLSVTVQNVA